MRSVGLITEYNPFHNGHLHHLQESLRVTEADAAVAVMSGHFLQRGEAALLDKWQRAEMALRAGVNLVVELPLPWACNSAPLFAEGAVQSLSQLGVEALCFGSEAGELAPLQSCADLLDQHQEEIDTATRSRLRQGENYPTARAEVVTDICGDTNLSTLLAQPNNILGIEYLRALGNHSSNIAPHTIRRKGAGYHDLEAAGEIASATGIRRMLTKGEDVGELMPETLLLLMEDVLAKGQTPDGEILFRLLVQALQRVDHLKTLYQYAESDGIGKRFYQAIQVAENLEGLMVEGKSKQLTRTRMQRLMIYALLDLDAGVVKEFLDCGPLYLHVLGHDKKGEAVLADCRNTSEIPLVGNYSRIRNALTRHYGRNTEKSRLAHEMLAIELRATRTYGLLLKNWPGGNRNLDFFRDVIRTG
jgi:predicted nucleotidyltransferase